MTISGLNPYAPPIPARITTPASPARANVPAPTTAGATTVRSASLWQVLTPEEKAFFLGAAGSIGYSPTGAPAAAGAPAVGQHLDVRA